MSQGRFCSKDYYWVVGGSAVAPASDLNAAGVECRRAKEAAVGVLMQGPWLGSAAGQDPTG